MSQKKYVKENLIILLFFMIVIMSQGIRTYLNNFIGISIFNYHVIPITIFIYIFLQKKNKFNKMNFLIFLFISGLIVVSFLVNRYGISNLLRTLIGFLAPLLILLVNYGDIDVSYFFTKIVKIFNVFIYITFIIQAIMSIKVGRTGGIVGHPLTSGWYYSIFISFNIIFSRYFNRRNDLFIITDIFIALVGTVLASGRISMIIVVFLGVIYSISCCRRKSIPYFILPIIMGIFLFTPMVNTYIWSKFKETSSWGDVTNGRMLGIREMIFFKMYPRLLTGNGIGYSNYISQYIFEVVNFENPIVMFSFDYGILATIFVVLLFFIKPIINFINNKDFLLAINYLCILIIPFTYNGLAETVGILIVLTFIVYIYLSLNLYISQIKFNLIRNKDL
ncbi:hypothetical protein [uncultured Clostridium sp.]|uniref:hypothetical protein n=1 Tax=uncultured Clostridium sp. TaxID=59620 RepID=UPI00258D91DE|nr:hypothetical protein [uncultured Clostridium sp.]